MYKISIYKIHILRLSRDLTIRRLDAEWMDIRFLTLLCWGWHICVGDPSVWSCWLYVLMLGRLTVVGLNKNGSSWEAVKNIGPVWVESNWIISLLLTRRKITRKTNHARKCFIRICFVFKIWPWKSKVGIASEVKVKSHKVGSTFYWHTSLQFHVNPPPHSRDTAFSNLYLEIPWPRKMPWSNWWPFC